MQQIRKSSPYSEPSTSKFDHFTMLFTFILNKIKYRILPCGTLISCSCSSEIVVQIHTWNFLLFKKFLIKIGSLPFNPIFPCGVIGLFYIKKYGCHMFFFGKSLSYEGFQADKIIDCASRFSKACLKVCD